MAGDVLQDEEPLLGSDFGASHENTTQQAAAAEAAARPISERPAEAHAQQGLERYGTLRT